MGLRKLRFHPHGLQKASASPLQWAFRKLRFQPHLGLRKLRFHPHVGSRKLRLHLYSGPSGSFGFTFLTLGAGTLHLDLCGWNPDRGFWPRFTQRARDGFTQLGHRPFHPRAPATVSPPFHLAGARWFHPAGALSVSPARARGGFTQFGPTSGRAMASPSWGPLRFTCAGPRQFHPAPARIGFT